MNVDETGGEGNQRSVLPGEKRMPLLHDQGSAGGGCSANRTRGQLEAAALAGFALDDEDEAEADGDADEPEAGVAALLVDDDSFVVLPASFVAVFSEPLE